MIQQRVMKELLKRCISIFKVCYCAYLLSYWCVCSFGCMFLGGFPRLASSWKKVCVTTQATTLHVVLSSLTKHYVEFEPEVMALPTADRLLLDFIPREMSIMEVSRFRGDVGWCVARYDTPSLCLSERSLSLSLDLSRDVLSLFLSLFLFFSLARALSFSLTHTLYLDLSLSLGITSLSVSRSVPNDISLQMSLSSSAAMTSVSVSMANES